MALDRDRAPPSSRTTATLRTRASQGQSRSPRVSPTTTSRSSRRCRTARSACSGPTRTPSASASVRTPTEQIPRRGRADEVPASSSAENVGLGMADDHMNVAVAADGTLYAAVKTSYDTAGHPKSPCSFGARTAPGTPYTGWTSRGRAASCCSTRSITLSGSSTPRARATTTSSSAPRRRRRSTSVPKTVVMPGGLNDVTSTKENWTDQVLVLASSATVAKAAFLTAGAAGNQAPVAVADAFSTPQDTAKVVAAPGVLGNDTDANSDPLTAVLVANVGHGTLALDANGGFTYTPTAGYIGPDSFTYKANDGTADSNTVTVSLTVTAAGSAWRVSGWLTRGAVRRWSTARVRVTTVGCRAIRPGLRASTVRRSVSMALATTPWCRTLLRSTSAARSRSRPGCAPRSSPPSIWSRRPRTAGRTAMSCRCRRGQGLRPLQPDDAAPTPSGSTRRPPIRPTERPGCMSRPPMTAPR